MLSHRSQTFSILLTFLVGLLAVQIQAAPAYIESGLGNVSHTKRSIPLPTSQGCGGLLLKRAVGAIPISSSSNMAVQQVARRAVGTVSDPGTVCTPAEVLRAASRLQARSVNLDSGIQPLEPILNPDPALPVVAPSADNPVVNELSAATSHLYKRSMNHKKTRPSGEMTTEEKWGRARAWK